MVCLILKISSCGLQGVKRMQGHLSFRDTGGGLVRLSLKAVMERPIKVQEKQKKRFE